ncbi:MAG TPA: hypothetical protein VFJ43_07710, partial [Bacteroidia bacterium]|nr:hypothetical protein [Bacteroidia bacterium]
LFISAGSFSQTISNNDVYLLYVLSSNDTSVAMKSDYYSAKFSSSFNASDYDKVLKLSSQRIWNHANAGDSLINYDLDMMTSFFTPDRNIISTQYLSPANLNNEATVFGPTWPGDDFDKKNFDRFRLKNGVVSSEKLTLGKDLRFIISTDTISEVSKKGIATTKLQHNYLDPSKMAMSFVEKWSFDPVKGNFVKSVNMLGYLRLLTDPLNGDHIGYSQTIYLDNPNGMYNPKTDVLLIKNVVCDESLKMWEEEMAHDTSIKSSPEETIELMQYGNSEIPSFERVKFLSSLFYYAYHNPAKVFPVKNNVVDSMHAFQSANAITNIFSVWDSTFQVEYPPNSGKFVTAPLNTQILMRDIYAIRFYEDWYYDPKEMIIKKKVNGIGFILLNTDIAGKTSFKDAGIYVRVN